MSTMEKIDWTDVSAAVEDLTTVVYFEMNERECADANADFLVERVRSAVVQHDEQTISEVIGKLRDFATWQLDRDAAKYVIRACENVLDAIVG